jgi:hypothetical protein
MALSTIPTRALTEQGINFRNIIINGDMSIAQRGTSETGLRNTGGVYLIDRWAYRRNGTFTTDTFDMSQSTDVPSGQGFVKSLKMDNLSTQSSPPNPTYSAIAQNIEGQNLQTLKKGTSNAESITISFWVKSNKTGTYILEVRDSDNDRTINKSYSINSASTWEKKTITYDGDTSGVLDNDNATSFEVTWFLSASSNFTSGTLQTSWGTLTNENRAVGQVNLLDDASNEWYITGVQLEVGTSASDFEFLPYDVNLQRCQRYFEQTYAMGTATGTATGTGTSRVSGTTDGSSNITYNQPFRVVKRTTPTITTYNGGGTSGVWNYVRSGASGTVSTNNWTTNDKLVGLYWTIGGGWNFAIAQTEGHWVADAEL